MFNQIKSYLEHLGVSFTIVENNPCLLFDVELKDEQSVEFMISSLEEHGIVMVHSTFPFIIPEYLRADVSALVNELNYARPVGNFELCLSDGLIRFKTYLQCTKNVLPTFRQIDLLLHTNALAVEKGYPAFSEYLSKQTKTSKGQSVRKATAGKAA